MSASTVTAWTIGPTEITNAPQQRVTRAAVQAK
jgi:hypothetical protein